MTRKIYRTQPPALTLSDSIAKLVAALDGEVDQRGQLECTGWQIVKLPVSDGDAGPPDISHILHDGFVYCFIRDIPLPGDTEMADGSILPSLEDCAGVHIADPDVLAHGVARVYGELPSDDTVRALRSHQRRYYVRQVLDSARQPDGPYASLMHVANSAQQLVEGIGPDRTVWMAFGLLDEFKTTFFASLAGSVSTGATFLGRHVPKPRPVIWYALEGKGEMPARLRAISAQIRRNGGSLWGNDEPPISLLDYIPENDFAWREQIVRKMREWETVWSARAEAREFDALRLNGRRIFDPGEIEPDADVREFASYDQVPKDYTGYFIIPESPGKICRHHFEPAYPAIDQIETPPLIVIDTLSMWTGKDKPDAEDINRCLDLLKQDGCVEVDEFEGDTHEERLKAWRAEYPGRSDPDIYINDPVASCVIIIHHPTKAGDIYAGQGSIGNNTQALYRVSRGGKLKDNPRVMTGTLTAWRTKDMTKPAPIRFEAEVVPVPNTTDRRIVIIRDRAIDIPSDLLPIVATLREQPTPDEISDSDLKALVDEHVAKPGQSSNALRTARHRCTKRLLDAGLIERNEDDSGQLLHFQFNDPGPLPC